MTYVECGRCGSDYSVHGMSVDREERQVDLWLNRHICDDAALDRAAAVRDAHPGRGMSAVVRCEGFGCDWSVFVADIEEARPVFTSHYCGNHFGTEGSPS